MKLDISVVLDDVDKEILSAADAWYEAMMASNRLDAVSGYENSRWARMGEENPYGFARARWEELVYDLNLSHEAAVRLIDAVGEQLERPSVVLVNNAKYIITGERW